MTRETNICSLELSLFKIYPYTLSGDKAHVFFLCLSAFYIHIPFMTLAKWQEKVRYTLFYRVVLCFYDDYVRSYIIALLLHLAILLFFTLCLITL